MTEANHQEKVPGEKEEEARGMDLKTEEEEKITWTETGNKETEANHQEYVTTATKTDILQEIVQNPRKKAEGQHPETEEDQPHTQGAGMDPKTEVQHKEAMSQT